MIKNTLQIFFIFHFNSLKDYGPTDASCRNSTKYTKSSGPAREVDFVVFAIFSNGGHFGFSTLPSFAIQSM